MFLCSVGVATGEEVESRDGRRADRGELHNCNAARPDLLHARTAGVDTRPPQPTSLCLIVVQVDRCLQRVSIEMALPRDSGQGPSPHLAAEASAP